MNIVFYSTSDVFESEELLINNSIECSIVPTPVTDKAYCGVCIKCDEKKALDYLKGFEYVVIE